MDLRSVAVLFLWEGGEREKYAREACAACRRGFVGGWLLGCRESAPLLQSPSTGSTRLTGWLFRAVGECGCSGDRIRAVGEGSCSEGWIRAVGECGCLGGWIRAVGEGGCLGGWIRVRLSGAPGVG
ncbi:MAG TPA: hypothetical protein DCZ78_09895 [Blautia sp.]|nr:hypothetical protein [Blautia sp.]